MYHWKAQKTVHLYFSLSYPFARQVVCWWPFALVEFKRWHMVKFAARIIHAVCNNNGPMVVQINRGLIAKQLSLQVTCVILNTHCNKIWIFCLFRMDDHVANAKEPMMMEEGSTVKPQGPPRSCPYRVSETTGSTKVMSIQGKSS